MDEDKYGDGMVWIPRLDELDALEVEAHKRFAAKVSEARQILERELAEIEVEEAQACLDSITGGDESEAERRRQVEKDESEHRCRWCGEFHTTPDCATDVLDAGEGAEGLDPYGRPD